MPQGTTTAESPLHALPSPVTANDDVSRRKGQIGVERSAAPALIALSTGLVAVSSNQPRAALLFVGAGTVTVGLYFIIPHRADDSVEKKTHTIMSTFLRRLPDVFTAVGCIFIMLGIGIAFPNQVALIPLFFFISFVALAALFGMILAVWTTVALYGAALVSLVTFLVLACVA